MKKNVDYEGVGVDLTASANFGRYHPRLYVSREMKPLAWDEDITSREDLFFFDGNIYLRYVRAWNPANRRPFYLRAWARPLYRIENIRMYNWDDFLEKCKTDWRFDWIRRTTNISPRHFEIAANNYGVMIPVEFSVAKYSDECGGTTCFTTKGVMEMAIEEKKEMQRLKKEGKILTKKKKKEQTDEH